MSVILAACSSVSSDRFEVIRDALRAADVEAQIVQCQNATRIDCAGKKFALVGIMGASDERACGFAALMHIAERCINCAVGAYFDTMGFQWFGHQHRVPARTRLRLGVFAGTSDNFPHANALICVGGPKIFVPNDDWHGKKAEIVQVIKDNMTRRCSF